MDKVSVLEEDKLIAYCDKEQCRIASKKLADYLESYRLMDYDYVGNVLICYRQKGRFFKDMLAERKLFLFEDEMYFGIAEYDKYLTITYGDYMKLPPENQRGRRHYYKAYERKVAP